MVSKYNRCIALYIIYYIQTAAAAAVCMQRQKDVPMHRVNGFTKINNQTASGFDFIVKWNVKHASSTIRNIIIL